MALILCCAPCVIKPARAAKSAANVDAPRINGADQDPANWITYGRTYSEQRLVPFGRPSGRQRKATWSCMVCRPRYRAWSGGHAACERWRDVCFDRLVDGQGIRRGERRVIWSYDTGCRARSCRGCCDVVNRGVAACMGKVYVALDGRLVALDARTGRQIWSVMTVDPDKPYTITQAPRVIKGRVVIGNSGAEYGVQGLYFGL